LSKQQNSLANEKWTDIKLVKVVFNIIPTRTPWTIWQVWQEWNQKTWLLILTFFNLILYYLLWIFFNLLLKMFKQIYIYIYVYMCICMHMYEYAFLCAYIYMYICILHKCLGTAKFFGKWKVDRHKSSESCLQHHPHKDTLNHLTSVTITCVDFHY
jgi:FlaA1/EpsC-like NDP-sugar epimerase